MKITPDLFEAFLKCPTKCWLRATNEISGGNAYAEWVKSQDNSYRSQETARLTAELSNGDLATSPEVENLKSAKWRLATNALVRAQENSSAIESSLHAVERIPSFGRGQPAQFVPIRFIHRNKLTKDDKLLLAFDALVLSEMLGRAVSLGKIIHGDLRDCARSSRGDEAQTEKSENSQSLLTSAATHDGVDEPQTGISITLGQPQPRVTKVKTPALAGEVRKRLGKITALLASPAPPDLALNRHCAECEFQARCRKLAVEKDDLSLLAGMSAKERQKLRSKGIFTVTQLSYTFRPRRRPKRQRDKREKYHHALKALAIREQKIHIVGSPELKLEGTPVYLDVEGLPDRDFYYLIGVRIGHGDSAVQHSLWADTVADEGKIWREFLALLETVEQPVLIHYGSYEKTFMKEMMERHGKPQDESVAAKAIGAAINLVSEVFAKIYFPTFSNGLKEIACYLGFNWASALASGVQTIVWRETWLSRGEAANRQKLISYNTDDCAALGLVTLKILSLNQARSDSRGAGDHDFVDTATLKREYLHGFKRNKFFFPELEAINKAAYWDYQREKVYVKSNPWLRLAFKTTAHSRKKLPTNRQIQFPSPTQCPFCGSSDFCKKGRAKKIVFDLKFTRSGVKRWIVDYRFHRYLCRSCSKLFYPKDRPWAYSKYGTAILAYAVYQNIELRLPQETIDKSINKLFGFQLGIGAANNFKAKAAALYFPTYEKLFTKLKGGKLLHADETKIGIRGNDGFVWVLASLDEVAYFYTESRESGWVQAFLKDFKGVLVCDFYTGYNDARCPKQRCLVHLLRDLNDDLHKNPYNEELKQISRAFTELVRPMIETVERYGLKARFLRRHLSSVNHFYRDLSDVDFSSEVSKGWKERFERNRDELFTFLGYDGIPWNNNNAEHAVKPFAKLRNVIGGVTTDKGIRDYLILLSLCETCKYMGVDFLDFLRSGEKDIHAFAESRRRRGRRTQTSQTNPLPPNTTTAGAGGA